MPIAEAIDLAVVKADNAFDGKSAYTSWSIYE